MASSLLEHVGSPGQFMDPHTKPYRTMIRQFLADMREQYESVGQGGSRLAAAAIKTLNGDMPRNTFITHDAIRVADSGVSAKLCVVEYSGRVSGRRYSSLSEQMPCYSQLVLLELPRPVQRIWIRPETMRDKLTEFFNPREIDLAEHREFSSRYYLLAEQPDEIERQFPRAFWTAVARHDGLLIKAYHSHMFVAQDRDLSIASLESILRVGMDVAFSLRPNSSGEAFQPARVRKAAPTASPFCYHCGETVDRNHRTCPSCAKPVDWD